MKKLKEIELFKQVAHEHTIKELSKMFDVHPETIYSWEKRFNKMALRYKYPQEHIDFVHNNTGMKKRVMAALLNKTTGYIDRLLKQHPISNRPKAIYTNIKQRYE